ncbi:MAG: hemerythrin domain-containing protein [Archangiaceae bacterium]|nr:hemerythrin domain-containing protein [Archangiaceae bacterium]
MADSGEHFVALFEQDHARIAALVDDVEALCSKQSYFSAAKVFGELRWLLEHHLAREDEALAKLRGALPPELCAQISASHRQLEQALELNSQAISRNEQTGLRRTMTELTALITAHERHELEVLLPALRRLTPEAQLEQQVRRLIER